MEKEISKKTEIGLTCADCEGSLVHQSTTSLDTPNNMVREQFECSSCYKDYNIYSSNGQVLTVLMPISGRA